MRLRSRTRFSRLQKILDAALSDLAITVAGPVTDDILTSREAGVFTLIGLGKTTKTIAMLLSISAQTIGNHRKHICRKLNLHSTAEVASYAAGRAVGPYGIALTLSDDQPVTLSNF